MNHIHVAEMIIKPFTLLDMDIFKILHRILLSNISRVAAFDLSRVHASASLKRAGSIKDLCNASFVSE